jgi:thiamine biosynthesis lipoprotein
MRYYEFRAMSTEILLAAEGSHEAVDTGFAQAQAYIEASEKRFTRFSELSELAELNRSAGAWFEASQELFELISLALYLHRQTRGLFDPAVLDALEHAGYDRTIDEIRRYGSAAASAMAFRHLDEGLVMPKPYRFSDIRLDADLGRIRMPEGMRIDLGGIAKGWIAEQAAILLSAFAEACAVNAGGDAFMIGLPAGEDAWRVTLEDPSQPEQGVAILKLQPGAVATSAVTKRRWQQAGKTQHHLIDPRTQRPAETDWLSVTVITPHAVEAEVYAKSLLIGGSREVGWISSLAKDIEFIAIDQHNQLWGSEHSREMIDV